MPHHMGRGITNEGWLFLVVMLALLYFFAIAMNHIAHINSLLHHGGYLGDRFPQ